MRGTPPFLTITILIASLTVTFNVVFAQTPSSSPTPKTQPRLIDPPDVIVDANKGEGSTTIYLRNPESSQQLDVSLTGVVNTAAPKPKVSFKADQNAKESKGVFPLSIRPNETAAVFVMVTEATQVGEFEIDLRNDGETFGKLKLVHLPFAVTLDTQNSGETELAMVRGFASTLTLKNDDPIAYPLVWRLAIDGREVCGDQLTLAAKGQGLIQCQPSVSFSPARIQDLFKVESSKGNLLLYSGTTGNFDKNSPRKIIPLTASLSYFASSTQQFWGYVGIVAILILGGVTSLLLSQALPNRLKRLNLKERLMDVACSTSNLKSNIGTRLQVLLRVERNHLEGLLESRNTFSPDFAGIATRCNEGTAKLEARVKLAQQIDVVLDRLHSKLVLGPPPSRVAAIEALIDDAKVLLSKTEPADKDLETAQSAVSEAAKRVETLNEPDDAFGQSLAKRVLEVQADIKANFEADPVFTALNNELPGPYQAVKRVPAGTTTIEPARYAELDLAVSKLLLMKEYVVLFNGTQDADMRKRLQENRGKLLGLLQLPSWAAMRGAHLLWREMKDDVYPVRLKEALLAKEASIVVEPAIAYDRAPLEFCVCFHSDALEQSAAREEWTCQWAFGDELTANGWTASHYFLLRRKERFKPIEADTFTVTATFRDSSGDLLDPSSNKPLVIQRQVKIQPSRHGALFGDRARTELLKLVAALFIAVFALVSGAREQLMKLDVLPGLIAVFLVGFGADTIKNLLTKSETTS